MHHPYRLDEEIETLLSRYHYIIEQRKWQTPFGISFTRGRDLAWSITYDTADAVPHTKECDKIERVPTCRIRREDIVRLVSQFDRKSEKKGLDGMFSVYKKPRAIRALEALFSGIKITAQLIAVAPLVWGFLVPDLFGVLCNPFNVSPEFVFSSSKLNFQVMYDENSTVKRPPLQKHVSLDDLLEQLRKYNMVPLSKLCSGCDLIATFTRLHKCTRCHNAYYCGKQCQKQGWDAGHRAICKVPFHLQT